MSVVFGYRTVHGVPLCPCGDPGNYLALETDAEGDLFRCWCGRTMRVNWDSPEERAEFIAANLQRCLICDGKLTDGKCERCT